MTRNKNAVLVLQNFLLQMGAKLPKFGTDGGYGSETIAAIDLLEVPEYVKIGLKEVGVQEIPGSRHNPRVLEYQSTTSGKYTDDETAWCGSFVSWVMKQAGIKHNIKIPERAKEWANFGYAVSEPSIGTIAVKSRVGGGHVCIVVGKRSDGKLYCLGGNQGNLVSIAIYDKSVFESFRDYQKSSELLVMNLSSQSNVSEA